MMKTAIPALIGILLGVVAGFGYDHFLGEGKQLADAQAQLLADKTQIDKAAVEAKSTKSETDALTAQVDQLSAKRDDLQKQVDAAKNAAPTAPAAPGQPAGFAGLFAHMGDRVKDYTAQKSAAKLAALVRRLNLTPDQEAKIKAAMDAQDAKTEEMTKKMFSGNYDPKTAMADAVKDAQNGEHVPNVDEVMKQVLTPDQKTTYDQMQTEEKNSAMETRLTMETNNIAPTLGLNEGQKDQVYAALGQAETQIQDPKWIEAHANGGDPMAILDAQQQAKQDALAKVLTPDQLAQWKKQTEGEIQLQRQMMNQFMPKKAGAPAAAPAPATP